MQLGVVTAGQWGPLHSTAGEKYVSGSGGAETKSITIVLLMVETFLSKLSLNVLPSFAACSGRVRVGAGQPGAAERPLVVSA